MSKYDALPVGAPIAYTYDGQVIALKNNPPPGYPYFLPPSVGTGPMPHDDLVSYYSANAKYQDYQSFPPNQSGPGWPMQTAELMQTFSNGLGQVHVTFSGALVDNVNSLENLNSISGLYNNGANWNAQWVTDYNNLKTVDGFHTLDVVHFAGHHSMGPLVGSAYFLKDLIFEGATLAQPYFLGSSYQSSHGFFPTELGFSERLIPTLAKMGVSWTLVGNNHFGHALKDYPYATYDAAGDCMISPPNRADLQDTSNVGSWVAQNLFNQAQVVVNKYPFDSTPHWVRYVDPATGAQSELAGIPVSLNGEWEEGYQGSVTVDEYEPYASLSPRQFFVIAHDGDNSSGRSGSLSTWEAGVTTTGSGNGYDLGIDEYLKKFPIPATDVQHVQDGSWGDVLDASTDPAFYHWHLPPMIWSSQFAAMNAADGTSLAPKKNLKGVAEGGTFSLENGWHYQERNYALLQAPLNYAETAEQIWLAANPNYWSPTTTLDHQVTYPGNQLNPWMIAAPVKGDPNNNYKGGANPAELAWYFLLPSMDSGFGYYGENEDDDVKPTLAFNNSLVFSEPYVDSHLSQDTTGPSIWWPQRYPYNPGSVNASKAEGWTVQWYNTHFVIYSYVYDVSGVSNVQLMVRTHSSTNIDASDDTFKVYDPAALQGTPGLNITPSNVSAWTSYPMEMRNYRQVMNGVPWVPTDQATMAVLPAQETGQLYYCYLNQYKDQLLDYYIQATDTRGNVTRSKIQTVMVGSGLYNPGGLSGYTESPTGSVAGTDPFITAGTLPVQAATPTMSPADGTFSSPQTVSLADSTSGATIYYTTDGSYPTTASNKYSGPFTLTSATLVRAIAVVPGYTDSDFIARDYNITYSTPTAATPAISPVSGSYSSSQTVTISDASSGAMIYYTTDGTTPTTSSSLYSGPLSTVSSGSETLKAIAVVPGYTNSNVSSVTYTIGTTVTAATPTFNPGSGALSSGTTVTISSATSGSTIYYTTDGSTPTTSSSSGTAGSASASVTVSVGETVKALAVAPGDNNSAVASATYTVSTGYASNYPTMYLRGTMNSWGTTAMSLVADHVWQVQVSLAASTAYQYKYDALGNWATGSNWGTSATAGTAGVNGGNISFTTSGAGNYTFQFNDSTLTYSVTTNVLPAVAAPSFSPGASAVTTGTTVTISSSTSGSTIYYTTDGSAPTTSSSSGTAGSSSATVTVSGAVTIRALAAESGYSTSTATSAAYTILAVAAPTFSPGASAVAAGTSVTISSATTGSTIYYTTDGTTPTTSSSSGTAGSGSASVKVSAAETIQAIAVKTGYTASAVSTSTYTIASTSSGTLTITFINNGSSQSVTFPGDANNWSLTANTLSASPNNTYTVTIPNGVTSTTIARGNNTSTLELQVCNISSGWNGAWGFGSWSKSSNISFSNSANTQISIPCTAGQNVTLTINVATTTLTATVQ
ncbi:MAG: alpha-amylase [Spirochaetales bacterium]|nr:alpha-amylase [Spirochaetales bacterium]